MTTKVLLTIALLNFSVLPVCAEDEKKALEFIQKLDGTAGSINRHGIKQPWTDTVGLGYRKITDEGLKELAPLRGLSDLHLHNTSIGDAGLKGLAPFKNLLYLGLDSTRITDEGLKELAGHEKLLELSLANTAITDKGLKEIAKIKNLHKLVLTGTKITDAGLKELAVMKNLGELTLFGTKITATGLKELATVKTLKNLGLDPAQVDDDTLRVLRANGQLHFLNDLTFPRSSLDAQVIRLTGTRVTDVGLRELADFKAVKSIVITNTKVTDAGIKQLKDMWPEVKVVR